MTTSPRDGRRSFPPTRWSRILANESARDLEALAQAYWRPMRAYLAARLRVAEDDASDLAQEAFAWLLTSRFFDRADPARGRFRGLLKKALAHFAIEHFRRENADKRGGGRAHEPLDAADLHIDPHSPTPDQVLDEAWRRQLLEQARADLQHELEANQRGAYYLLFRDYFLADEPELDHNTLAARHGVSRTDVSNWLDYSKQRYRARLRALVAETVGDEEELREELLWLFGEAAARRA
ncbi:MAG TPA: ECF-type sigma factor [Planctomycetota bacterium]|nr:ECF-type sigma factor [Planctomycetota bacterium]